MVRRLLGRRGRAGHTGVLTGLSRAPVAVHAPVRVADVLAVPGISPSGAGLRVTLAPTSSRTHG